jgi:heat shock protein HtpX
VVAVVPDEMRWQTDWGLRLRMAGTLAGLVLVYAGFVAALALAFGSFLLVLAGALVAIGLQYRFGKRIALRAAGADRVAPGEYPDLHARVGRLAQQAGVPKPDVAVVEAGEPNAFAAGRSREHATVCVTSGLLERLDGDELDAVLAHELAHVKHRDVALLTTVSALSTVAYLLVRNAWWFGDGGDGGGGDSALPWLLVAVVASLVVWVASYLLIRALSRYREYAADRGAAAITGDPAALAGALRTIEDADPPGEDLRESAGMAALWVVPGFDDDGIDVRSLLRTHPPTGERIERLRAMQASLAGE